LIDNIRQVIKECHFDIIFPFHPRTIKRLQQYDLWRTANNIDKLKIIDAVGYLDFLLLIKNTKIVMTDSGGIQEESCIMKVPCITLRDNTERPETVEVGSNIIVGSDGNATISAIEHFLNIEEINWENPFGDGKAGERIADICIKKLSDF